MGNRAVITTRENFVNNGIGIYVHWNGGYASVNGFLAYCEAHEYRRPETDCYGWARLCQVISNFFGGTTSIGIDVVNRLDCDNGDNGVYFIDKWRIVGREYYDCEEQMDYDLEEFMNSIDESMPKDEQLGKSAIAEYVRERRANESL